MCTNPLSSEPVEILDVIVINQLRHLRHYVTTFLSLTNVSIRCVCVFNSSALVNDELGRRSRCIASFIILLQIYLFKKLFLEPKFWNNQSNFDTKSIKKLNFSIKNFPISLLRFLVCLSKNETLIGGLCNSLFN